MIVPADDAEMTNGRLYARPCAIVAARAVPADCTNRYPLSSVWRKEGRQAFSSRPTTSSAPRLPRSPELSRVGRLLRSGAGPFRLTRVTHARLHGERANQAAQ